MRVATSLSGLRGDEDDDDEGVPIIGPNPHDNDADSDNDSIEPRGYYDRDDHSVRLFGHAPGAAQTQALAQTVERYYRAAVNADGARACSLLSAPVVRSVVQDYGRGSAGPAYLRSATTCAGVLTLLFGHSRTQLEAPIEIVAERVAGGEALVLLGSRIQPAGYLALVREGGGWRLTGLLATQLP